MSLNKLATIWKKMKYSSLAKFGRIYIKSPNEAPKGANIKKGSRGGYYYEGENVDKSRQTQKVNKEKTNNGLKDIYKQYIKEALEEGKGAQNIIDHLKERFNVNEDLVFDEISRIKKSR